ncbi:hypothetical protein CKAN_02220300 [Cinnamomum micranthum f. kanehirae]|uniref:Uncharacterized protein n=1 Tax=Cinnamomum micranthum f. kanehirae TaxID=337451 RepID=A0A443PQB7_9MAGN|nr:hypothetical protein CKAN_02220300 [Cinnamomum micranthum f. kanehirae]
MKPPTKQASRYCDDNSHDFIVGRTFALYLMARYTFLRKVLTILGRFVKMPELSWKNGVLAVTMDGTSGPVYRPCFVWCSTSGVTIGRHLYLGSLDFVDPLLSLPPIQILN